MKEKRKASHFILRLVQVIHSVLEEMLGKRRWYEILKKSYSTLGCLDHLRQQVMVDVSQVMVFEASFEQTFGDQKPAHSTF